MLWIVVIMRSFRNTILIVFLHIWNIVAVMEVHLFINLFCPANYQKKCSPLGIPLNSWVTLIFVSIDTIVLRKFFFFFSEFVKMVMDKSWTDCAYQYDLFIWIMIHSCIESLPTKQSRWFNFVKVWTQCGQDSGFQDRNTHGFWYKSGVQRWNIYIAEQHLSHLTLFTE